MLDDLPRWNSGTLSAKLAVRVESTVLAASWASSHPSVSWSVSGANAIHASAIAKTTTPVSIHGRRRPQRVRVRSDSAPASGFMMSAPNAPIGSTVPMTFAASSPTSACALSCMLTYTGAMRATNSPNCPRNSATW